MEVHYPNQLGTRLTHGRISPAFILSARVLDVNVDRYTVTVAPEFIKSPHSDISFATPYQHPNNGEGIYFMPEVGSLCWVCYNSEGGRPFVIGWKSANDSSGSRRANKQNLNPGDIYMGTRDENFMVLRRGGVVQIGSTPLAQTIYVPINNTIKNFCENFAIHSLGGDLEWTVRRAEETTDGTRPTSLKLSAKAFTDDPKSVAELEIGSQEGDQNTILRLVIHDSGAEGSADQITLLMKKTGEITWTAQGDVSGRTEGAYTVSSGGDMTFTSGGGVAIESKTGAVEITAASDISLQANVIVGGGASPVALANPLLTWLSSHTHACSLAVATTGTAAAQTGTATGNTAPSSLATTGIEATVLSSD